MYKKNLNIHFVGIGGIGMSGIAEVLLNLGYSVSGSDLRETDITKRLAGLGARTAVGHAATNVGDAGVVVVSSAVRQDNPELVEARQRKIPVILRAEMLAEVMRMKYSVLVAGTHGKTTTTSLVAHMLSQCGMDPTAIVGGKLNNFGSNAKLGQGEFVVAEADESDGSFLMLTPTIAVATNIEREHMEHYGTYDVLEKAFVDFLNKVPFYGLNIVCIDDPGVQKILMRLGRRVVTYGLAHQADLRADNIRVVDGGTEFDVVSRHRPVMQLTTRMLGRHNVLNSLAAVAVAIELGLDLDRVRDAFMSFTGIQRRFQLKGERDGVRVVDDYGHHPTEIRATLDTATSYWKGRIVVLFQPHRYTRTRDLLTEFQTAFYQADTVAVMDIYAASEDPIPGIDSQSLAAGMTAHGHRDVRHVGGKDGATAFLRDHLQPGDLLITLGAGDVWQLGERFLGER